ncbi:MAG: hypothetical protein DDT22_01323 [candidate division WS2 bacterium]|nr:hypothetical protein [Candidatus Lithacetigena glycinireducens]
MIKELIEMNIEEMAEFRRKYRALYGSRITIPFFESDGVPPNAIRYYFSKIIDKPFAVEKVIFAFPSGTGKTFRIYPLVSEDRNNTPTGYNLLSEYSESPFLVGDAQEVIVHVNPIEFRPKKYIKIVAENGSPAFRTMDARIELVIFPTYKER